MQCYLFLKLKIFKPTTANEIRKVSVIKGTTVTLNCTVENVENQPSFLWFFKRNTYTNNETSQGRNKETAIETKNYLKVTKNSKINLANSGAQLTLLTVSHSEAGVYKCVTSSLASNHSTFVHLSVLGERLKYLRVN